jgi:hypothetical protein
MHSKGAIIFFYITQIYFFIFLATGIEKLGHVIFLNFCH